MWLRISWLTGMAILTGCAGQQHDPRPMVGSWFAEVEAVVDHGHSGFAVVSLSPDETTRANLTMTGGSGGGVHPWHMHEGTCETGGPIVGSPTEYPLMKPDARGDASATVALDEVLSTDEDARYHVAMHQSHVDETVVGCGDLVSNRPRSLAAR
jgi:hypothetical protein